MEKQVVKKRKLKKGKLANFIFIVFSFLFLIFCLCFYGQRLFKYYRVYNPKGESGKSVSLLATKLANAEEVVYENSGLYRVNGTYLYKGNVQNNYVKFSNLLWRVIKVNADNTVEIVTEEPINNLMWNSTITDYTKSDIHKYLNDIFLKNLNKDLLEKITICTDSVTNVNKITCEKKDENSYVKLMSVTDFLNSVNKETFINKEDSLWLSDRGKKDVWYAKKTTVSSYEPEETYLIKPVVRLKMKTTVYSGTGTKEDPYIIEKEKKELKLGSYIKLGEDKWILYEKGKDKSKYILENLFYSGVFYYRFDSASNIYSKNTALGYYLNTTYYQSLPYKNQLESTTWYIGPYSTGYKDVYDKKMEAHIGLYNIADIKFNFQEKSHYLLTPAGSGKVYALSRQMLPNKVSIQKAIRPAISIKNTKIESGNGTAIDPYILKEEA